MNRRQFLQSSTLACSSFFLPRPFLFAENAEPKKRNIIVILTDDHGAHDLGCYGNTLLRTPHIDRLAREGARFTDAYSPSAVCTPSRASLLTGQTPGKLRITWLNNTASYKSQPQDRFLQTQVNAELAPEQTTIAEALKAQGYATALIGKWHLENDPAKRGFDTVLSDTHAGKPKSHFHPFGLKNVPSQEGDYLTDTLTDASIATIEKCHQEKKPFFLYLSHHTPHYPWQGKPEQVKKFTDAGVEHPDDANYFAMIENLDDSIGRLLSTLEKLGIEKETMIVLTGDNGPARAVPQHPFKGIKTALYEGGIRVPFIVWNPGTILPQVSETPVSGIDILPTALAMAGAPCPPEVEGANLLPLLTKKQPLPERGLYFHCPHYTEHPVPWKEPLAPMGAIRKGDFKLLSFDEQNRVELYNLKNDPAETKDLSASLPQKVKELQSDLAAWQKKAKVALPQPNPNHHEK